MAYPSETFISAFSSALQVVGDELRQFYAQLIGYLNLEHDENGHHTDLTATSITVTGGVTERGRTAAMGVWAAWTPTFTHLTVGNASLLGQVAEVGFVTIATLDLVWGSTTTCTGPVTIGLPVEMAMMGLAIGNGEAIDVSTGQTWHVRNRLLSTTTLIPITGDGAASAVLAAASPFVWTTGDRLHLLIVSERMP